MTKDFESDHTVDSKDPNAKALRAYGEQLALNELLGQAYGGGHDSDRFAEGLLATESELKFPNKARRLNFTAVAVMAACLAILCVLVWVLGAAAGLSRDSLHVVSVAGEVSIYPQGGAPMPLRVGEEVEASAVIKTGESSLLKLVYSDGTKLFLVADSEMRGNWGSAGAKQLSLLSGSLSLDVSPQPEGMPLRILTPYAEAQVIGTRLELSVKDDHTEMTVDKGLVGFQREEDPKPLLVSAGFVAELGPKHARLEANDKSLPEVLDFTLISVATGLPVAGYDPIEEGAILKMGQLPAGGVNIRVNTVGRIRDMVIRSSQEPTFIREMWPPYSVAGDDVQFGGDYYELHVEPGMYSFEAIPHDVKGERGAAKKLSIQFVE